MCQDGCVFCSHTGEYTLQNTTVMNCIGGSDIFVFQTVRHFKLTATWMLLCCGIVQVVSAAVDVGSSGDAQSSAIAVCFSENALSVCSSGDHVARLHSIGSEVNPVTDSRVTVPCETAESGNHVDIESKDDHVSEIGTDIQDLSNTETTLDYSICSDLQGSEIADTWETEPTMEYSIGSTAEPIIDADKNPVADIRTDSPDADDLKKPVDLLSISNSVDLRNSPRVCSPPATLVVV